MYLCYEYVFEMRLISWKEFYLLLLYRKKEIDNRHKLFDVVILFKED